MSNIFVVAVGVSAAGGLGIVAGGGAPSDVLHFVYAVLAFAISPSAALMARSRTPRVRALTTLVAALITAVVVLRLFQTG